jgi:hypothetical protein
VYPRIYQAMAQPIVGHLDPYFFQVSQGVQKGLRTVFGTQNELTIPISATGSGGMETAVSNFIEPGTKLGLFVSGFFAERIGEMAKRHGAEIVRLEKPWGESFSDDEVSDFIRREKPQVVAFVQAETSTGVFQQSKALCAAAHEVDAIVIADCVTGRNARGCGCQRHRRGLQLLAERAEHTSGIEPDHGFSAGAGAAEGAQATVSELVFRSFVDQRLPDGVASLPPHRFGNAVLCAT